MAQMVLCYHCNKYWYRTTKFQVCPNCNTSRAMKKASKEDASKTIDRLLKE